MIMMHDCRDYSNYSVEKLEKKIHLFYWELLDHFQELRSNYEDFLKREFIFWNNRDITIL